MLPKIDGKAFSFKHNDEKHIIAVIPPLAMDQHWPSVKAEMEKEPELWNKGHTFESIHEHLSNGEIALWAIWDKNGVNKMFFFTVMEEYPAIKLVKLVWASGRKLSDYIHMALTAVDDYAKQHNCEGAIIEGREGWGPILAPFGYSRLQTSFFKKVTSIRVH